MDSLNRARSLSPFASNYDQLAPNSLHEFYQRTSTQNTIPATIFQQKGQKPQKAEPFGKLPQLITKNVNSYVATMSRYTNHKLDIKSIFGVITIGQNTDYSNIYKNLIPSTESFVQTKLKFETFSIGLIYSYEWKDMNILRDGSNNRSAIFLKFDFLLKPKKPKY
jgi:hypothetical protein